MPEVTSVPQIHPIASLIIAPDAPERAQDELLSVLRNLRMRQVITLQPARIQEAQKQLIDLGLRAFQAVCEEHSDQVGFLVRGSQAQIDGGNLLHNSELDRQFTAHEFAAQRERLERKYSAHSRAVIDLALRIAYEAGDFGDPVHTLDPTPTNSLV